MNPGLQKLVDQGFMTEAHGEYIDAAVRNRDSIIVSGHKGWGILPLLATVSSVAKDHFEIKQVKGFDCLKEPASYYVIASPKEADFAKLVSEAMGIPAAGVITLKDPDHPYSLFKLLQDLYKVNGDTSKVYQVLECAKINDEKKLSKITRVIVGDGGKLNKTDF